MLSMSELESQLRHADPLADARAWLAQMERTLARLAAEYAVATENDRPGGVARSAPSKEHDQCPPLPNILLEKMLHTIARDKSDDEL